MRTYALQGLFLNFQSSIDYIKKRNEIIDTLYEILMKNDTINCIPFSLNTLIAIISQDEEKTMYLIDYAENYEKKSVTQIFSQIIGYLINNKDANILGKTLLFIIYEALEKLAKKKIKISKNN